MSIDVISSLYCSQCHTVLEGDNACVFVSTTPDQQHDVVTATHTRALKCLFGALPQPDAATQLAPVFRFTLSYVDVHNERVTDMLSLTTTAARCVLYAVPVPVLRRSGWSG